jgi:hypothetical protein
MHHTAHRTGRGGVVLLALVLVFLVMGASMALASRAGRCGARLEKRFVLKDAQACIRNATNGAPHRPGFLRVKGPLMKRVPAGVVKCMGTRNTLKVAQGGIRMHKIRTTRRTAPAGDSPGHTTMVHFWPTRTSHWVAPPQYDQYNMAGRRSPKNFFEPRFKAYHYSFLHFWL